MLFPELLSELTLVITIGTSSSLTVAEPTTWAEWLSEKGVQVSQRRLGGSESYTNASPKFLSCLAVAQPPPSGRVGG